MLKESIPVTVKCEGCNGKGYKSSFLGFRKKTCDVCSGRKEILMYMIPEKAIEKGFI